MRHNMSRQRGAIPLIVVLVMAAFVVGGAAGAFITWWMGGSGPTIVFSAFAIGLIIGLVFLPNAPRVIRWGKAVGKEWNS